MGLGAHRHRQAGERHGPGIAAGRLGPPGLRGAQSQDRSRRAEAGSRLQASPPGADISAAPPASANSPSALAEPASGSCRRPRRPRAGIGTGTSTGGERSRMKRARTSWPPHTRLQPARNVMPANVNERRNGTLDLQPKGTPILRLAGAVVFARRSWSGLRSRANAGTPGAVLEAPALVARLDDVAVAGEAIKQRPRSCLLPGIQGAGLRANQDNDGRRFAGVPDNQPSGSPCCTQNKNPHFELDLSWCERRSSRRRGLPGRREDFASGRRPCDVLRVLDARSIQPALTASNIASAGPVWPFGMPNCSNAAGHPARGTVNALTSRCMTSPN